MSLRTYGPKPYVYTISTTCACQVVFRLEWYNLLNHSSPYRIRTDTCTGLSRMPLPGWAKGPSPERS